MQVNKDLYDNRSVFQVLGCLIKKPTLIEEYSLDKDDFEVEPFHQIVFSAIYNLYQQGIKTLDSFAIDSYLSKYPKQYKRFEANNGVEFCEEAFDLSEVSNFEFYYQRLRKFSYLRFLDSRGLDTSPLYDTTVVEPTQREKEMEKLDGRTIKEMIDIIDTQITVEAKMRYGNNLKDEGLKAGVGLQELKESLKEAPAWGAPLQSPFLTTIFHGARLGKLFLKSSASGFGKSRLAMGDVGYMSVGWCYDHDKKKWMDTGFHLPMLYISCELDHEELQTLLLAWVSGINEDKIINGNYEGDEEEIVDQAIKYIEAAPTYFEVVPDFGISDIVNMVKKYKREKDCDYFIFDYLHMSIQLLSELSSVSRGSKLREDQILFLFIDKLKNLCNQLNIFMYVITQVNDSYRTATVKDESLIRGSKAICDRVDIAHVDLKPTKGDLEEIKKILSKQMGHKPITMIRYIYKVRRGKLTRVKLYQFADLGTCRTTDCFLLTYDNELVSLDVTKVENIDKVIDDNSVEDERDSENDDGILIF